MDGPIRVMGHLMSELRIELDKTARDLQEEFPIVETGVRDLPQRTQREGARRGRLKEKND